MTSFVEDLTDQLNLRWAWEKVRRLATPGDHWFDQVEVAAFELELERNLESIASDFRSGRYRLAPLRPVPYPKNPDEHRNPRVRQVFHVPVRDQVAWVAIVNLIGPHVDSRMPTWSYGNRLYRSMWVEEEEDGSKRRIIGRYRHSAGLLYLPFAQSWPIFRRHVFLTTRAMTIANGDHLERLDDQTEEELKVQELLSDDRRCPFVVRRYWENRREAGQEKKLYWCSVDLRKFYPSIKVDVIRKNIVEQLPEHWRVDADRLLASMLRFRLDLSEWTSKDLEEIDLTTKRKFFKHIPTGLYVAGFLANAALLNLDLQVAERLKHINIAHFRYVDDHIVLAYNFRELVQWVREYMSLLDRSGTGASVNRTKIEPNELIRIVTSGEKADEMSSLEWKRAEDDCELDPEFPSPLMTKTIALVSAIAHTDFDLLESQELAALTDQLEHLLLVDIPNHEIPEKTRLSFAATRLIRIVECRLASCEPQPELRRREDRLREELKRLAVAGERNMDLERELEEITKKLKEEQIRLNHEVGRAFQLLRKVLRDRPESTRLWSRALAMCRSTGIAGVAELIKEINDARDQHSLAREFLRANLFVQLGAQALVAALILRNEEMAYWRRRAAHAFLADVCATKIIAPDAQRDRWFLYFSWLQYCFGLYCASLVLKDEVGLAEPSLSFPQDLLSMGAVCIKEGKAGYSPAQWGWWATRMTLRDLEPHADAFVRILGNELTPSKDTTAFWSFFPLDVPTPMLRSLMLEAHGTLNLRSRAGWWVDALRNRTEQKGILLAATKRGTGGPLRRLLNLNRRQDISLYEWCDHISKLEDGATDPRFGEWTALEIVRQIAGLLGEGKILGPGYLNSPANQILHMHPANFRIPRNWAKEKTSTWSEWRELVRKYKVVDVPKTFRIQDNRYTPISSDNRLFRSVNLVRGLGLLLYGLLKQTFDLPSIWNSPGHADVLGMLPRLLLSDLTCSSWTLGILGGCLQQRAVENLYFLNVVVPVGLNFDDDTLRDPVSFQYPQEVLDSVTICQQVLERNQLSTLHQTARQLTPISILQLTRPEWSKDFEQPGMDEGRQDE